jgi:hypothetical protein
MLTCSLLQQEAMRQFTTFLAPEGSDSGAKAERVNEALTIACARKRDNDDDSVDGFRRACQSSCLLMYIFSVVRNSDMMESAVIVADLNHAAFKTLEDSLEKAFVDRFKDDFMALELGALKNKQRKMPVELNLFNEYPFRGVGIRRQFGSTAGDEHELPFPFYSSDVVDSVLSLLQEKSPEFVARFPRPPNWQELDPGDGGIAPKMKVSVADSNKRNKKILVVWPTDHQKSCTSLRLQMHAYANSCLDAGGEGVFLLAHIEETSKNYVARFQQQKGSAGAAVDDSGGVCRRGLMR